MGLDSKWTKLQELLDAQQDMLRKHMPYSNEMDIVEDIRHELDAEINKIREEEPIDTITETVVRKLVARSHQGVRTYDKTMDRTDLDNTEWLIHLHEELMDATIYLQKILTERHKISMEREAEMKRLRGKEKRE